MTFCQNLNRKKHHFSLLCVFLINLFAVGLLGQNLGILEQQILIEQNVHNKVELALDKLLDSDFIVSVSAEIKFIPVVEQESVVGESSGFVSEKSVQPPPFSGGSASGMPWQLPAVGNLPDEVSSEEHLAESDEFTEEDEASGIKPHSYKHLFEQLPEIIRLSIHVFLSSEITPQTEEQVRYVIQKVSGYDGKRGDDLDIQHAPFSSDGSLAVNDVMVHQFGEKINEMEDALEDLKEKSALKDSLLLYRNLSLSPEKTIADKDRSIRDLESENSILNQQVETHLSNLSLLGSRVDSLEKRNNRIVSNLQKERQKMEQTITEQDEMISALDKKSLSRAESTSFGGGYKTLIALGVVLFVVFVALLLFVLRRWTHKENAPAPTQQPENGNAPPTKKPDSATLRHDVAALRNQVVALSVGNPDTAKRIMGDWLVDAGTGGGEELVTTTKEEIQ